MSHHDLHPLLQIRHVQLVTRGCRRRTIRPWPPLHRLLRRLHALPLRDVVHGYQRADHALRQRTMPALLREQIRLAQCRRLPLREHVRRARVCARARGCRPRKRHAVVGDVLLLPDDRVMSPQLRHDERLDLVCGVLQEADVFFLDRPQPRLYTGVERRHEDLAGLLALAEVLHDLCRLARPGYWPRRHWWARRK